MRSFALYWLYWYGLNCVCFFCFANIITILFYYYYYCCIMYLLTCHGEIKIIKNQITVTSAVERQHQPSRLCRRQQCRWADDVVQCWWAQRQRATVRRLVQSLHWCSFSPRWSVAPPPAGSRNRCVQTAIPGPQLRPRRTRPANSSQCTYRHNIRIGQCK